MAKTGNKTIDPTIKKKVQNLSDQFLDCRDPGLRHAWMRENDFHTIPLEQAGKKLAALGREEVCMRCGTVKRERFVVLPGGVLEKISQSYEYPEGYLMPGIPRGVTPSVVVYQEQYRRAMEAAANAKRGERDRAER